MVISPRALREPLVVFLSKGFLAVVGFLMFKGKKRKKMKKKNGIEMIAYKRHAYYRYIEYR